MKVLVLGGAGFIGTHLVAELLHRGHDVTVLDNFSPQVHEHSSLRNDIAGATRLIVGDIVDKPILAEALTGQDVVVHLAAETGTGQSMYQVAQYERANGLGTANLFDCIVNDSKRTVHKVIVASSRAIYGEGKYSCAAHGAVYPQE